VIGGYLYRGTAIPQLAGAYLFVDMSGPARALGADGAVRPDVQVGGLQASSGEAPDSELYVLNLQHRPFEIEPS
jgi:hypothetical protein